MHLYTRAVWDKSEVLKEFELNLLQVLRGILVGHVGRTDVKFKIRAKILKVVIIGKFCEGKRERGTERVGGGGGRECMNKERENKTQHLRAMYVYSHI